MLNLTVLSSDRACELDLLLRSVKRFFAEWENAAVTVLYDARDERHAEAYELAADRHPEFAFVRVSELGLGFRTVVATRVRPHNPFTAFLRDGDVLTGAFSLAGLDASAPPAAGGFVFPTAALGAALAELDFADAAGLELALASRPLALELPDVPLVRLEAAAAAEILLDAYLDGRTLALEPLVAARASGAAPTLTFETAPKPQPSHEQLAAEARDLYDRWSAGPSYVDLGLVHPHWEEARPRIAQVVRDGIPRDFLRQHDIRWNFYRNTVGPRELHEAAYLNQTLPDLREAIERYTESPVGGPDLDAPGGRISVNSLGMLYYYTRAFEQVDPAKVRTVVEFGGGYGCFGRVARALLPNECTYVLVDLPEMLALQYVFFGGAAAGVVSHTEAPFEIVPGAVNLVPSHLLATADLRCDLFVSTFALSETPTAVQELVAGQRFSGAEAVYLIGQDVDADMWRGLGFREMSVVRESATEQFEHDRLAPVPYVHAWELLAWNPSVARAGAAAAAA